MRDGSICLNGEWTLRYGPQRVAATEMDSPDIPADWEALPARVPGNVELDLIRAGRLPADLDRGHNIYQLRELEKHQWWCSRTFETTRPNGDERVQLVLEGVDTLASVWLNGKRIGTLENMLIPHRLDVTDTLRDGANELVIGIDSPILAAMQHPIAPGEWAMDCNWESLHIRKAAHCYGWDIMPRAVTAGLWRSVYLEQVPAVRFNEVYLATAAVEPGNRMADIRLSWQLAIPPHTSTDKWTVAATISEGEGGRTILSREFPVLGVRSWQRIELKDVDLWWPRGFGNANLYSVQLDLLDGNGRSVAAYSLRTGFRTVRLDRTDLIDENNEGRFRFIVNGEEVFIKGTNWVPLDAFHSRDPEHLDAALSMVCDLNCNMVRCWGGNVYEDQAFFDRCDEEGLLVWQDFAFACALYPQTQAFHEQVRAEAETLIPLLRNHPSLALWAGNNEIDQFYQMHFPDADPNEVDKISREVLASACRQLDPLRDYLPSSPYFSPALFQAGNRLEMRPEDHLWGPRDDFKGSYYTSSNARFASEIGYHGCPSRSSLERMMTEGSLWPWQDNEEWLTHAVRPLRRSTNTNYRIPLMAHQVEVLFGSAPESLDDFIFASQFSQAEALKFFIERFRIAKGTRSGILWWNVRDGWPVLSDAVVDWYGEKKVAYYVIKRIQQDVCIMLDEPTQGRLEVVAVNDTRSAVKLTACIRLEDAVLLEGQFDLPPNERCPLGWVPASTSSAFYRIEWSEDGRVFRNHYLAGDRPHDVGQCRAWYTEEGLWATPPGPSARETTS